jgi:hypothetical protein
MKFILGEIPFFGFQPDLLVTNTLLDANKKCLQLICANLVCRTQARMVKLVEVEVGASNLVKVLPEMEALDPGPKSED